jgi:membrane-bound metal-dependent hydrolase YbcI (DUF457 family)
MLLLFHLFVGLIIGVFLYLWFRDAILIIAAAIGSILPDLFDKPVAIIVFGSTLGGRIYFHGLVFFFIVLVIGIIIWRYFHSFAGIALALGILSHQLLDAMWEMPVKWYYPFLGPYKEVNYSNSFSKGLMTELTSPSEWLIAGVIILILIQVLRWRGSPTHKGIFSVLSIVLLGILMMGGIAMVYYGITGDSFFLTCVKDSFGSIPVGIILIGMVAVSFYWILKYKAQ